MKKKYPFEIVKTEFAFIMVLDDGGQKWFYSKKKMAEHITNEYMTEKKGHLSLVPDVKASVSSPYCKELFTSDQKVRTQPDPLIRNGFKNRN